MKSPIQQQGWPQELKQFIADIEQHARKYPFVPPQEIPTRRPHNLAVARKDPLGSYWHDQLEQLQQTQQNET